MQLYDEYAGVTYEVPPEQELIVMQLQARNATTPEIVDALALPTPEAGPEESHGYLPASDGFVISAKEVPELHESDTPDTALD